MDMHDGFDLNVILAARHRELLEREAEAHRQGISTPARRGLVARMLRSVLPFLG